MTHKKFPEEKILVEAKEEEETWTVAETETLRSYVSKRHGGDNEEHLTWTEIASGMNDVVDYMDKPIGLKVRKYTGRMIQGRWQDYGKTAEYWERGASWLCRRNTMQ